MMSCLKKLGKPDGYTPERLLSSKTFVFGERLKKSERVAKPRPIELNKL